MIRFRNAVAATVLTLLTAPAAFAQSDTGAVNPPMQGSQTQDSTATQDSMSSQAPSAMSAESAGANSSATVNESSPTPPDQAYALKAGDPTVVSNAPIPDTRANRARFGKPMSMTGQRTAPAGN